MGPKACSGAWPPGKQGICSPGSAGVLVPWTAPLSAMPWKSWMVFDSSAHHFGTVQVMGQCWEHSWAAGQLTPAGLRDRVTSLPLSPALESGEGSALTETSGDQRATGHRGEAWWGRSTAVCSALCTFHLQLQQSPAREGDSPRLQGGTAEPLMPRTWHRFTENGGKPALPLATGFSSVEVGLEL